MSPTAFFDYFQSRRQKVTEKNNLMRNMFADDEVAICDFTKYIIILKHNKSNDYGNHLEKLRYFTWKN